MNKTFKRGDVVVCVDAGSGNNITLGKKYTIIGVSPAYVDFINDRGDEGTCFASRFKLCDNSSLYTFEKGKTYTNGASFTGECVYAGNDVIILINRMGTEKVVYASDASKYSEWVEPTKHVRYFNVYRDGVENRPHAGRGRADDVHAKSNHNKQRIACVRVEFVEGMFDD